MKLLKNLLILTLATSASVYAVERVAAPTISVQEVNKMLPNQYMLSAMTVENVNNMSPEQQQHFIDYVIRNEGYAQLDFSVQKWVKEHASTEQKKALNIQE